MLDLIALFDLNPIHIGFVLLLALLLFGPQKLPEIGKQLGSALRELKKAGSEMVNTFNTDHEPEYRSSYDSYSGYDGAVPRATPALTASTDLSDYTIAGQTIQDDNSHASPAADAYADSYNDYNIVGVTAHTADSTFSPSPDPGAAGTAESRKEEYANA